MGVLCRCVVKTILAFVFLVNLHKETKKVKWGVEGL